ncbi:hypothetical protein PPL_02131 [Heterostelium album PN500]|uniref:Uncharacterized protein n=1 Tax=Heterostelium pallidum (strain ATCC 26659 / Pp 5 / PN500) TaxID=670386 RepID=D3B1F8_HETP5|nr:hypothetical protein PPL_02131 [Heterostelium album PN500]EFA85132.1 hypothetical protein PPL_02131 [Heterostelium album PN500]|eukprot:XP_020437241.1 hypothetical protein PPL_02131 [Heterostelium album PN500]
MKNSITLITYSHKTINRSSILILFIKTNLNSIKMKKQLFYFVLVFLILAAAGVNGECREFCKLKHEPCLERSKNHFRNASPQQIATLCESLEKKCVTLCISGQIHEPIEVTPPPPAD